MPPGNEITAANRTMAIPFTARVQPCRLWKARTKYTHVGCVALFVFLFISQAVPRKSPQLTILGNAIRRHRAQAGLSQERLAEKADLHPVYVGKIERGEQWISLHALLRVARAIGVKASDLISEL
jgi:DNA-binding XRE family transcriptional regulator